ncbi:MAG: hypothetical protein EA397_07400 [Deltaproteobacteria bacterium]|nr:MAG: hypothetical protein EA397_07400 [Deltaproteobacteria bacterium]
MPRWLIFPVFLGLFGPVHLAAASSEPFAQVEEALSKGQKTQAADALHEILNDASKSELHGQAWVKLAELLESFDMRYAALLAYVEAIRADANGVKDHVGAALDLAVELGDERALGPVLADKVGLEVDDATRSRIALQAARHNAQDGNFGVALGVLMLVKNDDPSYAEAEALRGVVLAQQGRYNDALAPLLTAQALGEKAGKGARFRNVNTLNVARSYFGAENFPRAVEYYAKVERESDFWPQAWFEKAWAHFRYEDMNGTLAALMVHESPFYRSWHLPEADLLRAFAYFSMCKFNDATRSIDEFEEHYKPIHEQLVTATQGYDAAAGWNDGLAATRGETTRAPFGVLRSFTRDERFLGARDTLERADDELLRLQNVATHPFSQRAVALVQARREALIATEGARVVQRVEQARDELKDMLTNIQITRVDLLQFEAQQLERASQTGVLEQGDRIGRLRKMRKQRDARVWPWQGEYWADEVGYYQVLARPDCPEDLRPSTQAR